MAGEDYRVRFLADATNLLSEIDRIEAKYESLSGTVRSGFGGAAQTSALTKLISQQRTFSDAVGDSRARLQELLEIYNQLLNRSSTGAPLQQIGKGSQFGYGFSQFAGGLRKGDLKPGVSAAGAFAGETEARIKALSAKLEQDITEQKAAQNALDKELLANSIIRQAQLSKEAEIARKAAQFTGPDSAGQVISQRLANIREANRELERQKALLQEKALSQLAESQAQPIRRELGRGSDRQKQLQEDLRQATAAVAEAQATVANEISRSTTLTRQLREELDKVATASGKTATFAKGFQEAGASDASVKGLSDARQRELDIERQISAEKKNQEAAQLALQSLYEQQGLTGAAQEIEARIEANNKLEEALSDDAGVTKVVGTLNQQVQALQQVNAELALEETSEQRKAELLSQQAQLVRQIQQSRGAAASQGIFGGLDPSQLQQSLGQSQSLLGKVVSGAVGDFQRRFVATLQFAVSGALIFGVQRFAREFIQTAIEVERAFVDIASAFEFDTEAARGTAEFSRELEGLRQQILLVSNDFNVLPTVANEAAFALVSRFKEPANALIALRAQLLATKVATIDQSEALRALTAVSEAFANQIETTNEGLDLQERILKRETLAAQLQQKVLDQAVVIQQRWGVTVEDTVEGTARAAQVLSQLGFTAEETQALVAALSLTLGQTGQASAERLNRSIGQITAPQVKQQLLEIARASDEFRLSLSNFDTGAEAFFTILNQIERLQDIEPETVTKIFEAIGQRRELEAVAAVFQSADLQESIRRSFGDAAGAAEQRFSFLEATVSETIASIAARFEELAQNLAQLGALTPIKLLVILLDQGLTVLNQIVSVFVELQDALNSLVPLQGIWGEGLGDAVIFATSLLFTYKSIKRLIGEINIARAAALTLEKAKTVQIALQEAGLLRQAVAGGAGAAASAAGAGTNAALRASLLTRGTGVVAGLKALGAAALGPVAALAGLAAVGYLMWDSFRDGREAVERFNKSLDDVENDYQRRLRRGPDEGQTRAELELDAILQRQEGRFAAIDNSDFGKFREALKNIEIQTAATEVGDAYVNAITSRLTEARNIDGISDWVVELLEGGVDKGISDVQQAVADGDTEAISEALGDLEEIFLYVSDLYDVVESSQLEEFAEDLQSIRTAFSNLGAEQELGRIDPVTARGRALGILQDATRLAFVEEPGNQEALQAFYDAQKNYYTAVATSFENELADAELIQDDYTRLNRTLKIKLRQLEAVKRGSKANTKARRDLEREIFQIQEDIAEFNIPDYRGVGQSYQGLARNIQERVAASQLILKAIDDEIARLKDLPQNARTRTAIRVLENEQVGIIRNNELDVYEENTARLLERYRAARPVQDRLAEVGAELLRVERELSNWTGDESGRMALLNEQRRLRLEREQIYVDRVRASALLQAGVRNSTLELKAQITANAKELELLAESQGTESAAFLQLKLAQLKLKAQLADSILELEDINRRLDTDLTNAFEQAQLDLVEVLRKLQIPDLGDLERAQLELERRNAEAKEESAYFNDRLFQLKFLFETGELGTGAYISALEQLLSQVDTTTQQGKEIFLQIQGLIDGLSGDVQNLAFNVPSAIRLPTLFEIRRSLAADELGVNYQDNRQMDININVSNAVEMSELVSLLSSSLGDNITVDSSRFAPGAAGITLGGFNG